MEKEAPEAASALLVVVDLVSRRRRARVEREGKDMAEEAEREAGEGRARRGPTRRGREASVAARPWRKPRAGSERAALCALPRGERADGKDGGRAVRRGGPRSIERGPRSRRWRHRPRARRFHGRLRRVRRRRVLQLGHAVPPAWAREAGKNLRLEVRHGGGGEWMGNDQGADKHAAGTT